MVAVGFSHRGRDDLIGKRRSGGIRKIDLQEKQRALTKNRGQLLLGRSLSRSPRRQLVHRGKSPHGVADVGLHLPGGVEPRRLLRIRQSIRFRSERELVVDRNAVRRQFLLRDRSHPRAVGVNSPAPTSDGRKPLDRSGVPATYGNYLKLAEGIHECFEFSGNGGRQSGPLKRGDALAECRLRICLDQRVQCLAARYGEGEALAEVGGLPTIDFIEPPSKRRDRAEQLRDLGARCRRRPVANESSATMNMSRRHRYPWVDSVARSGAGWQRTRATDVVPEERANQTEPHQPGEYKWTVGAHEWGSAEKTGAQELPNVDQH